MQFSGDLTTDCIGLPGRRPRFFLAVLCDDLRPRKARNHRLVKRRGGRSVAGKPKIWWVNFLRLVCQLVRPAQPTPRSSTRRRPRFPKGAILQPTWRQAGFCQSPQQNLYRKSRAAGISLYPSSGYFHQAFQRRMDWNQSWTRGTSAESLVVSIWNLYPEGCH